MSDPDTRNTAQVGMMAEKLGASIGKRKRDIRGLENEAKSAETIDI